MLRALGSLVRARCAAPSAPAQCAPARGLLGSIWTRNIITVDVHQPPERFVSGDSAARAATKAEIARAEEIALSQYNRLVQDEVRRGTLRPAARRMKRFARFLQPTLQRRDTRRAALWRQHKARMQQYMNWIQYRRRRSLA